MNFQLLFEEFKKAPTLNAHLLLLLLLENNPFLLLTMRKNYLEGENPANLQKTLYFFLSMVSFNPSLIKVHPNKNKLF